MNQDQLKLLLNRDKVFLKRLYSGPNIVKNREILQAAEDSELNTLIKYLHFIANGEITITKENFNQLKESKKLKLIQINVENSSKTIKLLNASRKQKLVFLLKLSNVMPNLLYALFNLK